MINLENFSKIKAFVFDVDGVLTNSNLFIFQNGQIIRQLNEKDLTALKMAIQNQYKIAVISGGGLDGLTTTFQQIGINDIFERSGNKKIDYETFKHTYDLDDEQILYMGDDLPDYQVMRIVGLPVCPRNAAPEIKEISQYFSMYSGGEGCVRDVIEKVMKLQNCWNPKKDLT